MPTVPVIYRQALTGERLRYYGSWAKYLPLPLLQRIGNRLPEKYLWQAAIPCGERTAELSVLAIPRDGVALPASSAQEQLPVVLSRNLEVEHRNRVAGRSLALAMLRRMLPGLARQLELFGDRLSIALAVPEWERAFWVLGLEPHARSITILLRENEKARALGQTGIAVRPASYDSGRVDAHVLIVAPELLPEVNRLALRQGTLLVSANGLALSPFLGCLSLDLSLPDQLGLPPVIWADTSDQFPVLETVLIAAFLAGKLADWPANVSRRISLMDRVFAWSDWPTAYQLLPEGNARAGGELDRRSFGLV